jgi:MOSC domain-containing protein YiiM
MKRAVMAVVIADGVVHAGDTISIIDAKRPKTALQLV